MAYVKHYFNAEWPNRMLYHMMINTAIGDQNVLESVLRTMRLWSTRSVRDASALNVAPIETRVLRDPRQAVGTFPGFDQFVYLPRFQVDDRQLFLQRSKKRRRRCDLDGPEFPSVHLATSMVRATFIDADQQPPACFL